MATVGQKIAAARTKAKLSQKALGDKLGFGRSWVVSVETDRIKKPDPLRLQKVAAELGLNYRELLAMTNQLGAADTPVTQPPDLAALLGELIAEVRKGREAQETIAQALGEVAAYLGARATPEGRRDEPVPLARSGIR